MLLRSLRTALADRLALARLLATQPRASIALGVTFRGDASLVELGRGVTIAGPTVLSVENGGGLSGARLSVGPRTYIGEFNNIRCAGAPIRIGADCLISQHVTLVGTNHATAAGRPIRLQPWHGRGITVGDDVWIGAGAVLLPGATVGDGAVIAAGSVVRGDVAPGTLVGGVPARPLGVRTPPDREGEMA